MLKLLLVRSPKEMRSTREKKYLFYFREYLNNHKNVYRYINIKVASVEYSEGNEDPWKLEERRFLLYNGSKLS